MPSFYALFSGYHFKVLLLKIRCVYLFNKISAMVLCNNLCDIFTPFIEKLSDQKLFTSKTLMKGSL